jgi:hypothetical protein
MSHNARVEAFYALAGDALRWDGVKGCSRPGSDVRRALRADLAARQGNICPVCGNALRRPEFNHVVARGPMVRGFLPGNVFAGCHDCNARTAPEYTDDGTLVAGVECLTEDYFARADLIPQEWTPFPVLRKMPRA